MIHVIIAQIVPEAHFANLYTIVDVHDPTQSVRQHAMFAPLYVHKQQAILSAEAQQHCTPERRDLQCMVRHADIDQSTDFP